MGGQNLPTRGRGMNKEQQGHCSSFVKALQEADPDNLRGLGGEETAREGKKN